eukprot:scaffold130813_cov45-Phaeocystis_antarctica.AAC.1
MLRVPGRARRREVGLRLAFLQAVVLLVAHAAHRARHRPVLARAGADAAPLLGHAILVAPVVPVLLRLQP